MELLTQRLLPAGVATATVAGAGHLAQKGYLSTTAQNFAGRVALPFVAGFAGIGALGYSVAEFALGKVEAFKDTKDGTNYGRHIAAAVVGVGLGAGAGAAAVSAGLVAGTLASVAVVGAAVAAIAIALHIAVMKLIAFLFPAKTDADTSTQSTKEKLEAEKADLLKQQSQFDLVAKKEASKKAVLDAQKLIDESTNATNAHNLADKRQLTWDQDVKDKIAAKKDEAALKVLQDAIAPAQTEVLNAKKAVAIPEKPTVAEQDLIKDAEKKVQAAQKAFADAKKANADADQAKAEFENPTTGFEAMAKGGLKALKEKATAAAEAAKASTPEKIAELERALNIAKANAQQAKVDAATKPVADLNEKLKKIEDQLLAITTAEAKK